MNSALKSEIRYVVRAYFAPLVFLARIPSLYVKFLKDGGYLEK